MDEIVPAGLHLMIGIRRWVAIIERVIGRLAVNWLPGYRILK